MSINHRGLGGLITPLLHQINYIEFNRKLDLLEYGCEFKLLRKNLGAHLIVCPANILTCKAEWNRWPLYASERRKHIPFKLINPLAKEGQLGDELFLPPFLLIFWKIFSFKYLLF